MQREPSARHTLLITANPTEDISCRLAALHMAPRMARHIATRHPDTASTGMDTSAQRCHKPDPEIDTGSTPTSAEIQAHKQHCTCKETRLPVAILHPEGQKHANAAQPRTDGAVAHIKLKHVRTAGTAADTYHCM